MLFLIAFAYENHAQCTNTIPYPTDSVISNNSGDPQQINSCVYTGNYSTVSNLLTGSDYTFSLFSNGVAVDKYITVTDINNNAIAYGLSPLTVTAVNVASARVHYSESAGCEAVDWCLEAYVKITLSCPFPTNIQVNNVTTTNASFEWTEGGSETSWEVLVLPNGDPAPTPSTQGAVVNGTPSFSVNNLEAAHQYQFYVRANCESEYSPWRGPLDFNSGCNPIATFNENFDESPELPSCWTALKTNASPYAFIGVNSLSNSIPNAVQIANDNSGPGAQLLLISPNLSTVGTGTHRLKFYTRGYGNVTLQVGTIDTTTSDGTFNLIDTVNATANYTEHVVSFTGYTGSDTFVAFRHANTSTYNPVFIDDIRWEQSPLCPDVQNILATGLTQNTATIGWTPGGTEEQWDVVYSETATDPSTLTPISPAPTEPEATISGLQPNTTYKAWVRSSCGETLGVGAWMNPITFTTACIATNTFNETFESTANGNVPECWSAILGGDSAINSSIRVVSSNASTGSKAIQLYNGDEGISKIIFVAPSLNTVTTGTHRVKFYAKSNSPATLEIGTLGSAAEGSTFTAFQSVAVTPTYSEYVVNFATYAGTDSYIGFKHASGQYISIYIDNVRWELTPLCADVTQVSTSNTTADSTVLQWTANGGETQWDVVFGTQEVTDPNTLTPISPAPTVNPAATLSGLTPNTNYKAWVRSACGGTSGIGAWIGPIDFKTACLAIGEFSEGFETTNYGELPDCWSKVLAGPTLGQYADVRTVNNDAAFGNNAIEIHANSSAPTDSVMLVSPYLNTLNTGTHRLKFYVLSYNSATPFEIGTMNGNTSQATYTTFQSFILGSGYNELVVDFTAYSGTDKYIAFRNIAGNYNSTFIDNVRWEIKPLCDDVSNIQNSDVGTGSATITWNPGDNESNWQVAHAPVSVTDPSTLTPSELLTGTTYQISGLEDNTFYNVWVRSVCGGVDGNGAWIGPIVLRTKCLPTDAPYTQDFESAVFPNLPDCTSNENAGAGNNWFTTYGDSGYGFDGKVLQYSGASSTAGAYYFTQGVHLTGNTAYKISYKYGNNSSDNYVERMQVSYGTAPTISSMTNEIADHTEINSGMAINNEVTFTPSATGDYYFGFHAYSLANQGNLFLDNIVIEQTLSIPASETNNVTIYPNPVQDVLNIFYQKNITSVAVINILGQKVLENNFDGTDVKLNMSQLPAGSYLVKVIADGDIKTIKIIKK